MAVTNFSPLLGLALPTTGDLSGTWGVTVNDSITSLLDSAVAGTTTLSADADVTLTTTNGAANQSRNAIIRWTASNSVTRYITAPAHSKAYVVINAGTAAIVVRGSGPTTGVTIPAGVRALVAWNGSDYVLISISAGGSNNQVQYNSGNNLAGSANLTFDGTTLTAANFADSSLTSGRVTYAGAGGNLTDSVNMTFNGTRLTVADFADSSLTSGRVTYAGVAGVLSDSSNLTFDGSNLQIGSQGDLRFGDSDNSNWVAFQAPATVTSNVTWTLPSTDGTSGQVLQTNGSGTLSFVTAPTGLPSQTGNAGKFLTTDGVNPSWASTGAAAGGAIYVNDDVISQNYTIASGQNGFSVGPMTILAGYSVTISPGQRWVVL